MTNLLNQLKNTDPALGTSDWTKVNQDLINLFADATGDHQWIHVDEDRAAKQSPWGTTVAHGYYTLALYPRQLAPLMRDMGVEKVLNYGCNRVRFPEAVRAGDRVRAQFTLKEVDEGPLGAVQVTIAAQTEIEGRPKPACVAELLFLLFPEG